MDRVQVPLNEIVKGHQLSHRGDFKVGSLGQFLKHLGDNEEDSFDSVGELHFGRDEIVRAELNQRRAKQSQEEEIS